MISEPSYLAARIAAPYIEKHFENHQSEALISNQSHLVVAPSSQMIETVIDTSFWASLRHEEGIPPKFSIVLLPPELVDNPIVFEHKIRLTPKNITKLAPALEGPGIHLGVWFEDNEMFIWGTVFTISLLCLVLEVIEPGLLVIKHKRLDGFGKFVNVVVLKGDDIKMVDEESLSLTDCPAIINSLSGMPLPKSQNDAVNVLIELAASMRTHKRGGLLLVVPVNSEEWRNSIVHPISYPMITAHNSISSLMEQESEARTDTHWQDSFKRAVEVIGGITAVDGATILNENYELLAFGAKVTRAENSLTVNEVIITEPIVGGGAVRIHPSQNGGTRHLAAAQFVYDQRNAMALVASQDGRFTILTWSDELNMVHAHRIDTLLL
ncbi:putative sensor domain DACNV-containing protein [Solitalea lacus]|uniref:putative sensor domain DACNV-containing protein n=1 Tax=Solitalea lacus TaxID=2911172 RepID=UPI001EDAE8BB|nr:hypothetical protein [Solitalea lacus]UKJ05918.1 hypothetical protein L2B55_10205 [Solitalea lacus]